MVHPPPTPVWPGGPSMKIDIINKSKSLKGVMEPFSSEGNLQLLKRAGFKDIVTVFKYLNFEGFLSIK